jgi:hypothetical protein
LGELADDVHSTHDKLVITISNAIIKVTHELYGNRGDTEKESRSHSEMRQEYPTSTWRRSGELKLHSQSP